MFTRETEMSAWFTSCVRAGQYVDVLGEAFVAELKLVKEGSTLARSSVPEHQVLEIWRGCGEDVAGVSGVAHKISDSAIGYKPCDFFYVGTGGWLIVCFAEAECVVALAGDLFGAWYSDVERGSLSLEYFKKHGLVLLEGVDQGE